ncbi:hypothetical protein ACFFGN_06995 [Kribbella deserti]|uniref:DUF7296 domain-containing protein n=2 Tax=Kribbella deserti TaxID=1926257 RepID=A0ABV6QGQ0_9ACTN
MNFYTYRQNNSYGVFHTPAVSVVIEASTAEEADRIAVTRGGLYFDGCASGQDCGCCGDRWYRASEYDASADVPEVSRSDQWWSGDRVPPQLVIRAEAKALEAGQ